MMDGESQKKSGENENSKSCPGAYGGIPRGNEGPSKNLIVRRSQGKTNNQKNKMKVLQCFMMFLGMLMGLMMDLLDFGPKLCQNGPFLTKKKTGKMWVPNLALGHVLRYSFELTTMLWATHFNLVF